MMIFGFLITLKLLYTTSKKANIWPKKIPIPGTDSQIQNFSYLYCHTEFDIDTWLYKLAGSKKGKNWRALLHKRTSENDLKPPSLDEVIKDILN